MRKPRRKRRGPPTSKEDRGWRARAPCAKVPAPKMPAALFYMSGLQAGEPLPG